MKKTYFTMSPTEQQLYRGMLYRKIQSEYSKHIVHDMFDGSFQDFCEWKAEEYEKAEGYEELQALIDYFDNDR